MLPARSPMRPMTSRRAVSDERHPIPPRLSCGAVCRCGLRGGLLRSPSQFLHPPQKIRSAASARAWRRATTPTCSSSWKITERQPPRSACCTRSTRGSRRNGSNTREPSNGKSPTFCGTGLKMGNLDCRTQSSADDGFYRDSSDVDRLRGKTWTRRVSGEEASGTRSS